MDVHQLLNDVFAPTADECAAVVVDLPHGSLDDDENWHVRRDMAAEWRQALVDLGLEVLPLISYRATGAHNGDLPAVADLEGREVDLLETLSGVNLCVAMTEFSATAPLFRIAKEHPGFRAASMPGVLRRMEETALAADYREVARKAAILEDLLQQADSATIAFSTGEEVSLDLRFRTAEADNGQCRAGADHRIINLPSGESFIVPYEGEREGEPSLTRGRIPVAYGAEKVVFEIEENLIRRVSGDGEQARRMNAYFAEDPARANLAELGLGCNDRAVVKGTVLEDEKAGLHWAYGRSEHLGGVTDPDAFRSPENVVHQDIVYATGCPIGVARLDLVTDRGSATEVMRDNEYLVFGPPGSTR